MTISHVRQSEIFTTFRSVPHGATRLRNSANSKALLKVWTALVVGGMGLLWILGWGQVDLTVAILATLTGLVILSPIWVWLQRGMDTLPLFELICLYLFISNCPSVFLTKSTFVGALVQTEFTAEQMVNVFKVLGVGFAAVIAGYTAARNFRIAALPRYSLNSRTIAPYSIGLLALAAFLPLIGGFIPAGLRGPFSLMVSANACVAIFTLSRLWAEGKLRNPQWQMAFAAFAAYLTMSIASGWLNRLIYPYLFFEMGQFIVKKRIPWLRVALGFSLILLLNGSKSSFRQQYWGEHMGGGRYSIGESVSRTLTWFTISLGQADTMGATVRDTLVTRMDNLGVLAHVVSTTPGVYPHTGMWSYAAIPAMFVPRAVWPNKPSVMDIQNAIAMRYGYLSEHQVGRLALDVGLITEAYMAFGSAGVAVFMFLFGAFIRLLTNTLSKGHRGDGWELIFLALISNGGIMITWVAASYFAGIWQTSILIGVLYLPMRNVRTRRARV